MMGGEDDRPDLEVGSDTVVDPAEADTQRVSLAAPRDMAELVSGEVDPAITSYIRGLADTASVSVITQTTPEEPDNYEDWIGHLEKPAHFLTDMHEAEGIVRELKRVKRKLDAVDDNLDKALLRLRFPLLDEVQEAQVLESAEWPEMRELLLLFELRFIPRIPGIVYLLQRANDYLYRGKSFVGMDDCYGFLDIYDAKGFTAATMTVGASASARNLADGLYGPTFDALESREGTEVLLATAGDALVVGRAIDLEGGELEGTVREQHLRFIANVARGLRVPCHVTSGFGRYGVVVTPGGELVVFGEAVDRSELGQGMSKDAEEEVANSRMIVCGPDGSEILGVTEHACSTPVNDISQIHFFEGMEEGDFKDNFAAEGPEFLLNGMRQQMALMAAPMSREALQSKETVERSAISLYIQAPSEARGQAGCYAEILKWEDQLKSIAKKYNARVKGPTVGNGKKSGILIFGAQGSSQINKEERSALCANELLELEPEGQIGLKEGAIHISNMGEGAVSGVQEVISDAVNGSQRLATVYLEDGQTARIRMDRATYELFRARGIVMDEGREEDVELRTYGQVEVCLGEGFKMEGVSSYLRENKVEEVVTLVSEADPEAKRQWNLAGEFGTGRAAVLYESVRRLQSVHGMQMAVLPEHHDRSSYAGFRQVLDSVFATPEEFKNWLDKSDAPPGQRALWEILFQELHADQQELYLLSNPEYARPELAGLLRALGQNFGVACPGWGQMDRVSREILLDSEIILLAIDCPAAGETVKFGDIEVAEVIGILSFHLEMPAAQVWTSGIMRTLRKMVEVGGAYNPMTVEVLVKDWLRQGILTKGTVNFDAGKVDRARRVPRLEHMVTYYADKLKRASSRTLLGIALALGSFSLDELRVASMPPISEFGEAATELQNTGIFVSGGIGFSQPYFVPTGRHLQELMPSRGHAVMVERNMRNALRRGHFEFDKYLEACGCIGMSTSRSVIGKVIERMEGGGGGQSLLRVMDTGQQFMDLGISAEAVKRFRVEDFSVILRIYNRLIEAKLVLGEDVEGDLGQALALKEQIPEEMEKDLFEDAGRLLDLRAEAIYKANRDLEGHAEAVEALGEHYERGGEIGAVPDNPSLAAGSILLHQAKLAYRQADNHGEDMPTRISHIDGAICLLGDKLGPLQIEPFDSDVQRLLLQSKGHRLLDLIKCTDRDELTGYIGEVRGFLTDQPANGGSEQQEANLQLALFLARAYMLPRDNPIDIEQAERVARKIIEQARSSNFRDAGLKGYNYLMNAPEIKAEGLIAAGQHKVAVKEISRMEQMWEEMQALAAPLKRQEGVAGTLLASQLTWAFGLEEQRKSLIILGQPVAETVHKLKNEWAEIQEYAGSHPLVWARYSGYIGGLRKIVESL